ncbi:hypothetical protein Hanom_Chr01g00056161 [Helianthus anomalus]
MAMIPWTEGEEIALATSWLSTLHNEVPPDRTTSFWDRFFKQFCINVGESNQNKAELYSCFMDIRGKSAKFDVLFNNVENADGKFTEDDVIQVALVDYKHMYGHDFKHDLT